MNRHTTHKNQKHLQEQQRLFRLLQNHSINSDEYKILSDSLEAQFGIFNQIVLFFKNPFTILHASSEILALFITTLLLFVICLLAWSGHFHFPGLLDHKESDYGGQTGLLHILREITAEWLLISLSFWLYATALRAKSIRIIDFLVYCGIARLPTLFMSLILIGLRFFDYRLFITAGNKSGFIYPSDYIWVIAFYLIMFWQLYLYFLALKEASGLNGVKLWIGYIISIILAEVLTLQVILK